MMYQDVIGFGGIVYPYKDIKATLKPYYSYIILIRNPQGISRLKIESIAA